MPFLLRFLLLTSLPQALQVPDDQVLLMHLRGKGSQIYVCSNGGGVYAWKLKAPEAKLFDEKGALAGKHFAGPTWEAKDGSRVGGKVVQSVPASNAIPWLLLTATSHEGSGVMSGIVSIQRVDTKGGVTPASGCDASHEMSERSIEYEATYNFYRVRL